MPQQPVVHGPQPREDTLSALVAELARDERLAGEVTRAVLHALLRSGHHGLPRERGVVDERPGRTGLLRRLLLGEEGGEPAPDPARLGLRPGERYHCAVSEATDPAAARCLEHAFARSGGILAPVEGRLCGLTPRLPADSPALTVTTPAVPLDRAPAAYALCLAGLREARRQARTGMHSVVDLAAETALGAQPLLTHFLGEALLGALDPADEFHRDLVATAVAYLDHGQRLDRTADAVHLHPNTVRYRLRRLQELTGLPDHPTVPESVRWWWALRSWPQAPPGHR